MNNKFSWKNFNLLPKKQQRAIYTLVFSLLGFLLVVVISSVVLFIGGKGKDENSSSLSESDSTSSSSSTDIAKDPITPSEFAGTILEEADNSDANYLKETLFIGDSNTERLMKYGVISIDNFAGKTGLSVTGAATEACVYFKNDQKSYSIPDAVAKMKPRRVVITLGTNDSSESMETADFMKSYKGFIKALQEAYPHCDIIINSILPVAKQRSYKNIDMDKINDYNTALAQMAKDDGFKFLNSSEALRGTDGYGKANYFTKEDGIHIVDAGARIIVDYVRTHPYVADDRRPDTKNIPTRRPAPAATSSTPDSSSSKPEVKDITATYTVQVDAGKAMGYLKSDKFENKTTYTHTFTEENNSFTVTAVAAEGFVFESWSDGSKEAKRTDSKIKENIKLTAKFKKKAALVLKVDKESSIKATVGDTINFTATVTGDGADSKKVLWKMDGTTIEKAAASCSVKFDKVGTIKIVASYEGIADAVTISVKVSEKTDPITISISGPDSAKVGGGTLTYTATVSGTGADKTKVKWTIAGKDVSTGETMTYTPDKKGTVKIVATMGSVSKEKVLTVSEKDPEPPKVTISVSSDKSTCEQGEKIIFTATVVNGKEDDVAWLYNGGDTGLKGKIYEPALEEVGTHTIIAKIGDITAQITITVTAKAASE